MTMFELYLLTRLDALNGIFGWTIVVSIAFAVMAFIIAMNISSDREFDKEVSDVFWKWLKRIMWVGAASTMLYLFTPTKMDVAAMYGLHWATNNMDMKSMPDDAAKIVREWINKAAPSKDTTKPMP